MQIDLKRNDTECPSEEGIVKEEEGAGEKEEGKGKNEKVDHVDNNFIYQV
jgi:hypothetical protein